MTYRLTNDPGTILKIEDNGMIWCVPAYPDNVDYQEYQAWLALGNEPEAAE